MRATPRKDGEESTQNSAPVNSIQAQNEPSTAGEDKRKMQRRAAQKAYRERQEQHSLHLTQKIGSLEEANRVLGANNKQLELEIARLAAENNVLATFNSHIASTTDGPVSDAELAAAILLQAPQLKPPSDLMTSGPIDHPAHRITESETGEKLLDKAATWDMIQSHRLFKAGLVDIDGVRQRLEGFVQCTGQGIAFEEGRIRSAIEKSVICDL